MRDANRLDNFYEILKNVHKTAYPDLRFGQFMSNWLGWVQSVKKRDIFFPEESEMLDLLQEYVEANYQYNLGQDLFKKKKEN